MKIDMPPEMVAFISNHFKKRIEWRMKTMPDPDYTDPYMAMANGEDEKMAKAHAIEGKKKALEFIHNARLVIDLLANQANRETLGSFFSKIK